MKSFLITYFTIVLSLTQSLMAQDAVKGAELYKQCIACHGQNGE